MATQSFTNPTSATVAEVMLIVPDEATSQLLTEVIGFAPRFRDMFAEIDQWRPKIIALKAAFGVKQGCAGKLMVVEADHCTYSWNDFCRHYFNLSPRRINELLEPELPEVVITDEDVDFPDTESPTNEDEQEGNEKQKGEESEERDEGATDKAKRKRIHHGTANRAALADFAKQVIPVLLNAPEGTTKEQIYDKAREISITFCEDHPDLAMDFRVPEMELKPDPRIAELTEETAKLKTLVRHQRDQISGLERGNGELNREIAVLRGRDTKAKPATD